MRVAYFITSYRPPPQLLRLLGTLRRAQPDSPLVVHHDRYRAHWTSELVAPIGGVEVLTSDAPVSWGDFSIVDATWTSLAWMVANLDFDWIVLLSEQDYPIAPLTALEQRLEQSDADALVQANPVHLIEDDVLRMECDRRYSYRYVKIPRLGLMARLAPSVRRPVADTANRLNFILYKLQRSVTVFRYPDPLPMRLGFRPRRSPFSADFPCWYGSQWMALSRAAATEVVGFVKDRDDYVRHYSRTVIPDESATATIVCNDPRLRVINEELHHIRFSSVDGHPDVFGVGDLDELLHSGRFFARKFDMDVDSAVLDLLDEQVLRS